MCIVAATSAMPGGFGGGGGGGHEHVVGSVKVPIHTVHKHHYQRVPEYKIVKVPVIKEVKVPYPVKVPGNFCLNRPQSSSTNQLLIPFSQNPLSSCY